MEFIKKHKNKILILVIVIIAFVVYSMFFTDDDGQSGSTLSVSPSEREEQMQEDVGGEFLDLLLNITDINLNDDIFANESFRVLRDLSVQIPRDDRVGRNNPFAPIGEDEIEVENDVESDELIDDGSQDEEGFDSDEAEGLLDDLSEDEEDA